jgi:hypothetical protein
LTYREVRTMLEKLATAVLLVGLAFSLASPAVADQSTLQPAPPPDSALTARFTVFLTDVLAGRVPTTGLSEPLKAGLTPDVLSQIDRAFASLGLFQKLEFVREDTMPGYQRYHYVAVFNRGTQGVMFVTDSSGAIAGFFKDQAP